MQTAKAMQGKRTASDLPQVNMVFEAEHAQQLKYGSNAAGVSKQGPTKWTESLDDNSHRTRSSGNHQHVKPRQQKL